MSPELGFLLFVALLWGPTALWVLYRAAVSPRNRVSNETYGRIAAESAVPAPASAPPDFEEFWACASCRSLNRREAKRCYSCRAQRSAPPSDAAEGPAVTTWVPVMAPGLTPSPPPGREPVAATVTAAPARTPPARSPVAPAAAMPARDRRAPVNSPPPVRAVEAGSPAASPAGVAVAAAPAVAVASVTTLERSSAPQDAPASTSETEPDAAGAATVPEVCPFLGLRDDPSTRLDFPDSRNACHAASGLRSGGEHRRPGTARLRSGKARAIEPDHQATHCLAATHLVCPRYPAVATVHRRH